MIRPRAACHSPHGVALLLLAILVDPFGAGAMAQEPPAAPEETPGQFFTVTEPITSESVEKLKAATREYIDSRAREGKKPILVFEFVHGETAPGTSDRGVCSDLATEYITPAWAGPSGRSPTCRPRCRRAMPSSPSSRAPRSPKGRKSSLGPITPEGQPFVADRYREVRCGNFGHQQGQRPRPAAGHARSRRRP